MLSKAVGWRGQETLDAVNGGEFEEHGVWEPEEEFEEVVVEDVPVNAAGEKSVVHGFEGGAGDLNG